MSSNFKTELLASTKARNFDISSPSFEYIMHFDVFFDLAVSTSFCTFFVFSPVDFDTYSNFLFYSHIHLV